VNVAARFVDVAGLSAGGPGGGLAAQGLGALREADALAMVLAAWGESAPDPVDAAAELTLELTVADLESVTGGAEKAAKKARAGVKDSALEAEVLARARDLLDQGTPLRTAHWEPEEARVLRNFAPLTLKPALAVLNLAEADAASAAERAAEVEAKLGLPTVAVAAALEAEAAELPPEDAADLLRGYGVERGGLDQVVGAAWRLLDLIVFLTTGEDETRAWEVHRGATAPEAAGRIHSDLQRGFIAPRSIARRRPGRRRRLGRRPLQGPPPHRVKSVIPGGDVLNISSTCNWPRMTERAVPASRPELRGVAQIPEAGARGGRPRRPALGPPVRPEPRGGRARRLSRPPRPAGGSAGSSARPGSPRPPLARAAGSTRAELGRSRARAPAATQLSIEKSAARPSRRARCGRSHNGAASHALTTTTASPVACAATFRSTPKASHLPPSPGRVVRACTLGPAAAASELRRIHPHNPPHATRVTPTSHQTHITSGVSSSSSMAPSSTLHSASPSLRSSDHLGRAIAVCHPEPPGQPPETAGRIETSSVSSTGVDPREIADALAVDEHVDMAAQDPTVVEDPLADPGMHLAEGGQDLPDGGPGDLDPALSGGVAGEGTRQVDNRHRPAPQDTTAALTQTTGGSHSARACQLSPSSEEANSCPVRVPVETGRVRPVVAGRRGGR
jgi:hypothetical protein